MDELQVGAAWQKGLSHHCKMVGPPASCMWWRTEASAPFLCLLVTRYFCEPLDVGLEKISSWGPYGTADLENVLKVCLSDLFLAVELNFPFAL